MAKPNGSVNGWRVNGWRIAGWSLAALLLALPRIAMQLTDEVTWTAADFAFAGGLIGGVGVAFELAVRATRSRAYRGGIALALMAAFLLVWINAAVGIIGDEGDPLNLLYAGVLAVALGGAVVARFRAGGMARAMAAAAVAQALVGGVALAVGPPAAPGWIAVVLLHGVFVALFAGAAALFRRAARAAVDGSAQDLPR